MNQKIRSCAGIFILSLSLVACKKDDEVPPRIQITEPGNNESVSYGENLFISLTASDETGIDRVTVKIRDAAGRQVLQSRTFNYDGAPEIAESFFLPIDDVHLESGSYTLTAEAFDGTNTRNDFTEINIWGAPLVVQRLFVLSESGTNETRIDSLTSSSSLSPALTLSGLYNQGVANSWSQSVHLAGRTEDGILTYGPELLLAGTLSIPFGLGPDLYQELTYDPATRECWVACRDGFIRELGSTGTVISSIPAYYPIHLVITDEYIFSYGQYGINPGRIEVIRKSSGALVQSYSTDEDIRDLLPLANDERILVVRNDPDGDHLVVYDRPGNAYDNWTNFMTATDAPVRMACATPQGLIVVHDDGIYVYATDGSVIRSSSTVFSPVDMETDRANGALWLLEEDALHRISYTQQGLPFSTISLAGGVPRSLTLLYNK